ncbi:hypothetical protein [Robertmurraya andreesenii]|uniref:ParB/Sulfiredoxin domain-containing protein n=1 Tax=Anoxybacillus andreesenii TaxID=1325932 RepID=A0ABT9VAF3_9BACL|nr:hypothetical protein [Robertmurraya andreesenii]MDQ0157923.1 hypothetical protein [Robertmurraya andreesenii]
MSSLNQYKIIDISEIMNYVENPRHDVGSNEIDTIKKLVNKVGSQYMYNLAKDIYENGLLGSNLPVLVYDPNKGKYIVYEGNRRVACLKFLNNPEILTSIDKSLMQRIENLKKEDKANYSNKINCYITSEEEALLIMERTHSGEDKGRGLKAWSSKEKGVFESRRKKKSPIELVIADQNEKFLNEDITQKISYTTIRRFFNNREIKKALGIDEEFSNIDKNKIIKINFLIDKAIEESNRNGLSLTRLFNKAREIEDFFLPLIKEKEEDTNSSIKRKEEVTTVSHHDNKPKEEQDEGLLIDGIKSSGINLKESDGVGIKKGNNQQVKSLKISLKKDENKFYYTNQTIDLNEKIEIEHKDLFEPQLLRIECSDLVLVNGIIQPDNIPGEYSITFKYYMDNTFEYTYWQDSLKIVIKAMKAPFIVPKQQTVLSETFYKKYYENLQFEHSDKIKSLLYFLTYENKNGKYSPFLNIVSRMFLEYTFRLYASKVLKEDNHSIDIKSKSLQGFIDYCLYFARKKYIKMQ